MTVNKERGNAEVANQKLMDLTRSHEKTVSQLQEAMSSNSSFKEKRCKDEEANKSNTTNTNTNGNSKEEVRLKTKVAQLVEENKNLTRAVTIKTCIN